MDKSLDEIVSASRTKGPRRGTGRRNGARAQVLGIAPPAPTTRARIANTVATNGTKATPAAQPATEKIIVSNLPADVNETQVRELFNTTVGPLREVNMHYDSAGRSKGVATVTFSKRGDGNKAYQQYNNRLIDGKRPMKIEVVVDPSRIAAPSLVSRVAPAANAPTVVDGSQPARRVPGGARGRGGRKGGVRKAERPAKSVADLDAEMEDYTASNGTAAPAAVA